MISIILHILKITLILIIIDIPYLYLNVADFKTMIKDIQGKDITIKYFPALITYLIMSFGIYYFCIRNNSDIQSKMISAAILGFTVYGTFDFTSMTIFDGWKYKQTIIDVIWGSILFTLCILADSKFEINI
jgi:uncharacterized membrane protein